MSASAARPYPQHGSGSDRGSCAVVEPRDFVQIADTYVADAIHGRSVVCGWAQKAAQRFQAMRRRADEAESPFTFSAEHANAVCRTGCR